MKESKNIPSHWQLKKLGDVCDIKNGKNQKAVVNSNGIYPIYGSAGIMGYANEYLCDEGTTVVGRKGTINRPIYVNTKFWNVDTAFGFSPDLSQIHSKYLYYFCKGFNFSALDKSTTIPSLAKTDLQKILIPISSKIEQQIIVTKIEELFSELDKGVEQLKTAQQQLKIYRQSLLKSAFEGRLTQEHRENKLGSISKEQLLHSIESGRNRFYEQQLLEWEKEIKFWEKNGKQGKKPTKPSKLTVPDLPNADHLDRKWTIPNEWAWTQLGTICFVTKLAGFEYTDYVKYDEEGDLFVIKAENAGSNGFKNTEFSKIKSESVRMLKRSFLEGGELLITFVGAGTGSVAIVPKDKKYFLGPNIGMARPYLEINTKFFEYLLQSTIGKSMLMATMKAVAQPSLSMGTIRQTPVVFPSLDEQNLIVQEIESRLSIIERMEETIIQKLQQAEVLRQSILKQAFAGKLVDIRHQKPAVKIIPLFKPKNEYFYQLQVLGLIAKASKQNNVPHGEMTLAKYAYLTDKLFDVPTFYNYQRWHLGPFPPIIKKVFNNKQYFKKVSGELEVLNEKKLFKALNPYQQQIESAVAELTSIFSKYEGKERAHKTELLATVCKVVEDIQTVDLKAVRASMADWKIELKGEKHKTKAEKFTESETKKCLAFLKEKEWDKKLIKSL